ncbi:GOLPH3/VPS74 family protein [Glycomyces harbinensis]|uniref:Golgi phosphoprotein 3 (GPP34) n=1 Tax=Glycomyces harbinensis TaxID=58114 RepID=A0A1G6UA64_9ACTN|nr:GPP34 family phosphoprotein [Glycomyces harbinensis]SDD38171.1 Golgi phosphoprotein 3 (GPP34) [Glycomyces harbinensis]
MPTLLEELALISHESTNGRASTHLDLGLGGAVLYELVLAGRIGLDGKKVRVLDPTPTGDPLLDSRLAAIAADKPCSPHALVKETKKGLLPTVRDGLVASGALLHESTKSLGIFTDIRYRSSDRNATADARTRLASAARNGRAFDERTQALLSLVAAIRLENSLFPDRRTRPSRKEIRALAEAHWIGTAIRRAIANRDRL